MNGILTWLANDWNGLNLRQVDVIVLEDHEGLGQATNFMGNFKAQGSLVAFNLLIASFFNHKYSREIFLMRFYAFLKDLQSILFRGNLIGNSCSIG